ncbi:MAG: hypothetical protein AAGG99_04040 [Pseudomonadota bacterium]
MAIGLHIIGLLLTGLVLGIIAWHFETASLSFSEISTATVEQFPFRSYIAGLLAGLVLASLYHLSWTTFWRRFWVHLRLAFRGADVLFVGLACIAILLFL